VLEADCKTKKKKLKKAEEDLEVVHGRIETLVPPPPLPPFPPYAFTKNSACRPQLQVGEENSTRREHSPAKAPFKTRVLVLLDALLE